jgi:capsular polysaccharide transport system permease protein
MRDTVPKHSLRPAAAAAHQRARRWRSPRTIFALMLREMSTTYGRSPGGYLWTILEPVGGIALLTLLLTLGLRIRLPSLGVNFALFYATGLLPLLLYQRASSQIAAALTFSAPLLYYPGVTHLDAILARFLLNLFTHLLISTLIFGAILWLFETRAVLDPVPIIFGLGLAALLALGIGSLNAFLFPTFPLWETLWRIMTFPLFLMSSVVYTFEQLPPLGQEILWFNPLVHIVAIVRRGFFPTYEATWASPVYCLLCALVCLTLGLALLQRFKSDILSR